MSATPDIYSGRDPSRIPAYGILETSRYLGLPPETLRVWTLGRPALAPPKQQIILPVVLLEQPETRLLSFVDLVEVHVLSALRRQHRVPLQRVRLAIEYLRKTFHSRHPLADHKFQTDGLGLFVEHYGELIDATQEGQMAIKRLLEAHLRRVERDREGRPTRLYLFTRLHEGSPERPEEPRIVVMDPRISFGRPVLVGTGIPTDVIARRYKAGESIEELAKDFDRSQSEIEDALRCELAA